VVTKTADLRPAVDDFVERLKRAVRVDMVVLFGSYASHTAGEGSDIDLAVFSRDFEGISTWERQEAIARATVGRAYRISPIAFSMEEYRKHDRHSFVAEVLRTGKMVYPAWAASLPS
jgi:predicted nucleotidyltransferase